jgi:hypothetical protein
MFYFDKDDASKWVGCFQKQNLMVDPHGHDGFNIGKDVPLLGTKLWV